MPASSPIKLVAIGGGTGLSTLLAGLKPYLASPVPKIVLTAIVTVTDDGRSSGRLRDEFSMLPPGDIRNCLVALANEANPLTTLFKHRFPGDGPVGGHSLGNLILTALNQSNGSFLTAVEQASALLGLKARVLPSTLERVDLIARVGSQTIRGQVAIKSEEKSQGASIRELTLFPPNACALPAAVTAIGEADLITIGPGSLFTSVIANVLIEGIAEALAKAPAKKMYLGNAMTEFDETDGFSATDHVRELLAYAPGLRLDYALFNSAPISDEMRQRYEIEKAKPIPPPIGASPEFPDIAFISVPLVSEARAVRHDPDRLSQAIFEIYSR